MTKRKLNGKKEPERLGWRLKKTLARKLEFRPIEAEDMRYIWAAYKTGNLASMGGVFTETDMTASEFRQAFEAEVVANYHGGWTLFADTAKGFIPVGVILGFWSHPDPRFAPFMIIGDILWMPWATPRNKIESAVNFFAKIRKEISMVEYSKTDDKKFFETIAKHGIMRRVGTSFSVYSGEPSAVFETRKPQSGAA